MIKRTALYLLIGFWLTFAANASARIMLNARVNDQPVRLLIDTRSDRTVLFAHAARRIGVEWTPPTEEPTPGRMAAGRSKNTRFDTGSGPISFSFNVVDLPQYEREGIDGVLSWTNLKSQILFLDGERRQFATIGAIPEWAKDWPQYPIKPGTSGLIMQTGEADILIETGNGAGLRLGTKQWEKWIGKHGDMPYSLKAYSLPPKGLMVDKLYYAKHFAAGAFELENILVERDSSAAAEGYDLSIGLDALAHLMIIVDIPNKVFYVSKSETAPPAPEYNRLGAVFIPENMNSSKLLTAVVAAGSPAAKAGIQDGDALMRLGDMDITQWRTQPGILPLGRFWVQPAGTRIPLEIQRDGKSLKIEVRLENFLDAE